MIGKNNPFNIRYSCRNQWLGLDKDMPVHYGFCNFIDRSYGIRVACYLLLRSYRMKGIDTIDSIIRRFAPPSENSTDNYIKFVSVQSRVYMPYAKLVSVEQYAKVLHAMSIFEGNRVSYEDIIQVINRFKIKLYENKCN